MTEGEIRTWHDEFEQMRSFGDRAADAIASFAGSWLFFLIHVVWFAGWIIFDVEAFPYGLLTMIVSLEAIFLSSFILLSQNRQSDRDRHQAQADYETNVAAKEEIEDLQRRLARIEDEKLDKVIALLEKGQK